MRRPWWLLAVALGCLGAGVVSAPSSDQFTLYPVRGDTVDASPWIWTLGRTWDPNTPRVFCVLSYAEWPGFVYVRHVALRRPPNAPCLVPGTPVFYQAPNCPDSVTTDRNGPAWLVVQCGLRAPYTWTRYSREPSRPSWPIAAAVHPHGTP